jgi:8-oxo-dGTP diphosphatase
VSDVTKITDVAVAVFIRPDGCFLLSSRPAGKPYAGFWEFPGGKIERGETVFDALRRELIEELNVVIDRASPWFTYMMHYEHASVRLHAWRVTQWHDVDAGGMRGMEGQQWRWQCLDAITVAPTLLGCAPIFRALALPTTYVVTNASEVGGEAYLKQIRAVWSKNASERPSMLEFGSKQICFPRLVQIRENAMLREEKLAFSTSLISQARKVNALVMVNSDLALARTTNANGVHLTSAQLKTIEARPDFDWVGASVHTTAELARAAELKCDFAVLGSVKQTASHPGQTPIGWTKFGDMVRNSPIPVFAIGGLTHADMADALAHGAHGIAMQRAALSEQRFYTAPLDSP